MKAAQITRLRDQLMQLRKRLETEISRIDQARVGTGESSDLPSHPADRSVDGFDSDLTVDLRLREELRAVELALQRTQDGSYGHCENCGKAIQMARLEAVPFTAYCIHCERQMEKPPGPENRPR
jgi:DnaK suppressor protein